MSTPYLLDGKRVARTTGTTTEYPIDGKRPKSRPPCKFAHDGSTGTALSHEVAKVLRHRLLLAALIVSAGFTIFFVRHLLAPSHYIAHHAANLVMNGCAAAALILIATILGSHFSLSTRQLRSIEIVLFGVIATFFGWLQIVTFRDGHVLEYARSDIDSQLHVMQLASQGNLLRWFSLIVIYGTFVPNTWKRCAIMVGIWAAIPIALMMLTCFGCPVMGKFAVEPLFNLIILLGMASAIAVFGSWKISELREEAIHAKQLGQYRLKELIGSGGMGEVYLGEHTMLRRACAIKLIRPDQAGDGTNLSRFEREVRAMATLTHWNTVEIYDYGHAEDGTFYYVMEYLPGLSLQDLIERYGPLPPARAIHFLRQVCDALQEAHSIGLIHRDIKPSNVLATERGGIYDVAKLLDFGLVQSVGVAQKDVKLTIQGVVLGSPPYMSPEQAMGKSLDHRTDIYSMGALAYFLLTGQPPFERDAPMQVLMAHVYDKIKPPTELRPELPLDLEAVILKCLSKAPADRYGDAESLEQALSQCAAAGGWDRHDAVGWWRQHQERHLNVPQAVA